ncbi:hypothetical protein MN608_05581 [Microdochium nivale]|nr:hypothetical protein MN608_05581 [Microdochium nivale]
MCDANTPCSSSLIIKTLDSDTGADDCAPYPAHQSSFNKPDTTRQCPPHQISNPFSITMDFVNSLAGNGNNSNSNTSQQQSEGSNNSGGGIMDKLHGMAGGGRESEKNEDALDKTVDFVQEKFLGQGDQSNESAVEQAKDEQISDFVRGQYKSATGSEVPIADKERF